jgi:two-component system, response regulator RegA
MKATAPLHHEPPRYGPIGPLEVPPHDGQRPSCLPVRPTSGELALVVTPDAAVEGLVRTALSGMVREIVGSTPAELGSRLELLSPALVVIDVDPYGEGVFDLLGSDSKQNAAAYVALGGDFPAPLAFRLAQTGVRAFVPKPVTAADLSRALRDALDRPPDLAPLLRAAVGHWAVHDLERTTRRVMLEEALARSAGSRRAAAKLLRVSRQLLQHMIRGQKRAC